MNLELTATSNRIFLDLVAVMLSLEILRYLIRRLAIYSINQWEIYLCVYADTGTYEVKQHSCPWINIIEQPNVPHCHQRL